jgi:hypothetical protein
MGRLESRQCLCLRAIIDPHSTYRIWADVDGVFQAIFSQHEGDIQLDQHGVYHERHLDSFEIDEEGFVELILSPDEHEKNWIPSHPDARFFTIRLFISDWENHTAPTFHIERIGAEGEAPGPPLAGEFARRLDRTIHWVEESSGHWNRAIREARERATPNIAEPVHAEPGGADNIVHGRCFWKLAEGEALIVTTEVPNARYWGFAIQTLTWPGAIGLVCQRSGDAQLDRYGRSRRGDPRLSLGLGRVDAHTCHLRGPRGRCL